MSVVRAVIRGQTRGMNRNVLVYTALAITIVYGMCFAFFGHSRTYTIVGALLVSLSWIAVGVLGRGDQRSDRES